jgi:hypothetical protein
METFEKGCIGLLSLRLGIPLALLKQPQKIPWRTFQMRCFDDEKSARKYWRKQQANLRARVKEKGLKRGSLGLWRLFAIQFDTAPAGVSKYFNRKTHEINTGWLQDVRKSFFVNYVTWHEVGVNKGFWEWINHGLSTENAAVRHKTWLPATWKYTVFCVVKVKINEYTPPAMND